MIVGIGVVALSGRLDISSAWLMLAAVPVAVISFWDDHSFVPVVWRFAVQTLGACMLIAAGLILRDTGFPLASVSAPLTYLLTILFVVWMTNLYNFMDGMDGFAAGMAVFGFGSFAISGGLAGDALFASLSAVTAAAAAGFLVFNFPPARIFMGDTGSAVLGLLAAGFMLWGSQRGVFPLWTGLIIFSPFIVDATVTLLRRLIRAEPVWKAHKTHYYQRLVQLGWGHRRTVVREYMLMAVAAVTGIGVVYLPSLAQWFVVGVWVAIYLAIAMAVHRLERRAGKRD
jgi:UDP-N-acetylmuramyl pentapeptide phosphotransferase/UDP-N-acetylglucosamine-1-phosphate transferase